MGARGSMNERYFPFIRIFDKLSTPLGSCEFFGMWARQMQIFIAEDMNELEAAKIMLGGLLESGKLNDPGERRFLKQHLEELERRIASKH